MFMRYRADRCYVIAEIAGNFTTFEEAARLIDAAAVAGADAVKLQTYRAETLSSRKAIFDMENTGITPQFSLFEKYQLDEQMHRSIFVHAQQLGLDWFSTPSHESDVEMLETFGVGAYKIGSDDACNLPFLRFVAGTGKPIILSTGMCTLAEIHESVDEILAAGTQQLILLHAITSYPTPPESVNLAAIQTLKCAFPALDIGYSDHTVGPLASLCAVAMGAKVIEKHFTLDSKAEGPDHILSAEPAELSWLVNSIRQFEKMKGDGVKQPAPSEEKTRINNRKSIVLARPIGAGDRLDLAHLSVKRPGYGIAPKYLEKLVGRVVNRNLASDDILLWSDLD